MESGNNGPIKPVFTKYRLAECVICLVVILFGVLYLNTEILSLWMLLPVFLAAFIAIPVLRYLDEKKRGIRGLALGFSVSIAALPAVVVLAALLVYFL